MFELFFSALYSSTYWATVSFKCIAIQVHNYIVDLYMFVMLLLSVVFYDKKEHNNQQKQRITSKWYSRMFANHRNRSTSQLQKWSNKTTNKICVSEHSHYTKRKIGNAGLYLHTQTPQCGNSFHFPNSFENESREVIYSKFDSNLYAYIFWR